jgi:glycosyltransferase involved in cell wall biosynthesis
MRVLHIYSGNLYGGIETMLVTLARERSLCPEMEPHFALCFEGRLSDELHAAGAQVHQLGNVRASQPQTVWRARRKLADLLQQVDYDAVICHAPWSQAIFGPVVRNSSSAGLPLIFWLHSETDGRHWTERWARRTPPDLALCNSHFTASTLSCLYPHARAEVIYCPITSPPSRYAEDERRATRAELKTPEDATVIIQVSRMEALKGHLLHFEALSSLNDMPGWVCWLVGGAQRASEVAYETELRAVAMRLGISERVRFVGERSDVSRLLHAADIYCQPNVRPDAFGISFIEALDAGLPVVTTALGGACEVIDASCGILVPPGDVPELASALRDLLDDGARRHLLGDSGRARARKLCDPAAQMARIYESAESVLQGSIHV